MELSEEAQRALGIMHTPLSDVLNGQDRIFERFIQANAHVFAPPHKQEPVIPAKPEQQRELITLKLAFYGIGIDLREAWRRFQCWWSKK